MNFVYVQYKYCIGLVELLCCIVSGSFIQKTKEGTCVVMLITSRQTLVMSVADSIKEGLCDISQIKEKETNHDKTRGK